MRIAHANRKGTLRVCTESCVYLNVMDLLGASYQYMSASGNRGTSCRGRQVMSKKKADIIINSACPVQALSPRQRQAVFTR